MTYHAILKSVSSTYERASTIYSTVRSWKHSFFNYLHHLLHLFHTLLECSRSAPQSTHENVLEGSPWLTFSTICPWIWGTDTCTIYSTMRCYTRSLRSYLIAICFLRTWIYTKKWTIDMRDWSLHNCNGTVRTHQVNGSRLTVIMTVTRLTSVMTDISAYGCHDVDRSQQWTDGGEWSLLTLIPCARPQSSTSHCRSLELRLHRWEQTL